MKRFASKVALMAAMIFAFSSQLQASTILFVADDSGTSSSFDIATVLTGDGHTVTSVLNDYASGNAALLGAGLGIYDAIYWSASGSGFGGSHSAAVVANLSTYVTGGGNVFVTGYDSVSSPGDPNLYGFLGATGQDDLPSAPGAISLVGNSLTTGVVDITGLTPSGAWGDRDTLTGLTSGTIGVTALDGNGGYQWTLRSLGAGQIAYVSAGRSGVYASDDAAWLNTSAGGAGAYNAALRNFAANSVNVPEPTSLALLGIGAFGLALRRRKQKRNG